MSTIRGLDRLGSEILSQVFGQGRPRVSAALSSLRSSEAEPLVGLRRSLARTRRALLLLVIVTLGVIELGDRISIPVLTGLATRVKAEVGRPRTPVSVAGVARRSARRD
jgi:hypothetical protein